MKKGKHFLEHVTSASKYRTASDLQVNFMNMEALLDTVLLSFLKNFSVIAQEKLICLVLCFHFSCVCMCVHMYLHVCM